MEFEGLHIDIFDSVYPPSEDTFLLLDAAKEIQGKIAEVGCGSGLISLWLAKKDLDSFVVGTDINPMAVENARHNQKINYIKNARFINTSFLNGVDGFFDWVLFNPPYLPPEEPSKDKWLEKAVNGGREGEEVSLNFLDSVKGKTNNILILQSSLGKPQLIEEWANKNSWKIQKKAQKSFFFERLFVYWLSFP